METYARALLYAIPFFMILMLVEMGYGAIVKNQKYKLMDTLSSLSSGLTNILKDVLGLGIVLFTYPFFLKYLAITTIDISWLLWFFGFIALDFAGYWNHRLSHKINVFWNQHVIHHSSEEFNLACALRQSISNIFGYFPILLIPAAILGIPQYVIATLAPIHLFAQFWYHTQHIGKLGWLEYIIVTPSQHRVHHAINPEYIDKNLGQILSVWDRLFGTFQEELDSVPPQYGVLKPVSTWNPIVINFQHIWRIIQDAWRTRRIWDKVRIWFMPTGWRPDDVMEKYPLETISDVYGFKRYNPPSRFWLKAYAILQFAVILILLLTFFYNFGILSRSQSLGIGLFLFISIYGYTSLMDGWYSGFWIEISRSVLGLLILNFLGSTHFMNQLPYVQFLLNAYFVLTLFGVLYVRKYGQQSINPAIS
jgi:sterol desaturase/sphingolipid hydroxylase (fatty acid hydroxylase superfamily)